MKKLLLTSDGLNDRLVIDFFVGQLKDLPNKSACMIATRRDPENQIYIDAARKELEDLGIIVHIINISEDIDLSHLGEYDIYYVCGGNTFYILDRMRKTGIDEVLIQAINDGKLYIGVSAGSIVVGPDIATAGWGEDGDPNDIDLKDLSGFGVVPYFVLPHYVESYRTRAMELAREIETDQSIVGLTDAQALFVTDDETTLIGKKGGLLLKDSRIAKNARFELEEKTGKKVVSGKNFKALSSRKKLKG